MVVDVVVAIVFGAIDFVGLSVVVVAIVAVVVGVILQNTNSASCCRLLAIRMNQREHWQFARRVRLVLLLLIGLCNGRFFQWIHSERIVGCCTVCKLLSDSKGSFLFSVSLLLRIWSFYATLCVSPSPKDLSLLVLVSFTRNVSLPTFVRVCVCVFVCACLELNCANVKICPISNLCAKQSQVKK